MKMDGRPGPDADPPSVARVYDYWLGGKDHTAADRDLAERMIDPERGGFPGLPLMVRENRGFLTKAAVWAANKGLEQFLDLGCGMPTEPAIHQTARSVNRDARVCYIDHDPLVLSFTQTLAAKPGQVVVVDADLFGAAAVLADPAVRSVIDRAQRACVILAAVLHFLPSEQAGELVRAYADAFPSGSCLVISVGWYSTAIEARLREMYTAARWWNHTCADVAGWVDGAGLQLVRGRVDDVKHWPLLGVPAEGRRDGCAIGGVAVKP
jgi:O-methyltransferase involved in polyketide biosynthesis